MRKAIGSVFVMVGAEPNSGCLYGKVMLDKKGYRAATELGLVRDAGQAHAVV